MPRYVCDECGETFESKDALRSHSHEEDDGFDLSLPDVDPSRMFEWEFQKKLLAVLGAVLMSTLFMGTAFFYSSISPGGSGGGGSSPAAREPSPPVGYTIQSAADVPRVPGDALPSGAVSETQLGQDAQLNLLAGADGSPAVLLQYSCEDCQGTVNDLVAIAEAYNSGTTWVYVAPYRDMESRVAATAFRRSIKMDGVNRSRIEGFICSSLRGQPVRCAVRGAG